MAVVDALVQEGPGGSGDWGELTGKELEAIISAHQVPVQTASGSSGERSRTHSVCQDLVDANGIPLFPRPGAGGQYNTY